jgi:hypothetical protein
MAKVRDRLEHDWRGPRLAGRRAPRIDDPGIPAEERIAPHRLVVRESTGS